MIKKIKERSLYLRKNKSPLLRLYSTLFSEANLLAKNEQRELTEDDLIKVINKIIKNNNDTISKLGEDKRIETFINENKELTQWLPKQLSKANLEYLVLKLKPKNIGEYMKFLNKEFKNQFDGKIASQIVKEYLK